MQRNRLERLFCLLSSLLIAGCTPVFNDDLPYSQTQAPGDDDRSPTPEGEDTPGDDDSSPTGDDDASMPGDDDASMPGDDDASMPGDDDASMSGDDDASVPGDDDASVPGDDDASVPGDDDASVPGDDDDATREDLDSDGFSIGQGDCDDRSASIYPGASELCDSLDNNCNDQIDESVSYTTFYRDADGDGYGNRERMAIDCVPPSGYVSNNADCDDTRSAVHPDALEECNGLDDNCNGQIDDGVKTTFYIDSDGDGFGSESETTASCNQPSGYATDPTDCDDKAASVYPGADELCNGLDDDCNGYIDNGIDDSTFYLDADNDAYGSPLSPISACAPPPGYSADWADCDDADSSINPGAPEQCNAVDDNCNSTIDEDVSAYSYYPDIDGDGYGVPAGAVTACAQPSGYSATSNDCDDYEPSVHPNATETCNGVDDNCNSQMDDGVRTTYFQDSDGDGYGNSRVTASACSAPTGYVTNGTDCDDSRSAAHPGGTETCNSLDDNCDGQIDEGVKYIYYRDADGDSYGSLSVTSAGCSSPTGYVTNATDCDDTRASVHPGASETCNSLDDNCDGQTDEGVKSTFYADADKDGYGDSKKTVQACAAPTGYVANTSDCDDTRASVHPNAAEACNGVDDNCDAQIDEGVKTTFYLDSDKDGYGDSSRSTLACAAPTGYVALNGDCDDTRATVNPGVPELCNGLDDNCNGQTDEAVRSTFYPDADGDGYGSSTGSQQACTAPVGMVADSTDCDDTRASVHPGVAETCNGLDDNCDGQTDNGLATSIWYADADLDGYGSVSSSKAACAQPPGYVANATDCNDSSASIHPGATELCNSADDNCDGQIDEGVKSTWYQDSDGDSYGNPAVSTQACTKPSGYVSKNTDCDDGKAAINPGVPELCNGVDDNCDAQIDEGVKTSYYQDADGDAYGNPAVSQQACSKPSSYATDKTDCDDTKASVHPNATETCNSVDDNCNGQVDEGITTVWYKDADGDGYGNASISVTACTKPAGSVADKTDCNDASAAIHPGATEVTCDAIDQNCSGASDDHPDADGDGYDACAAGVSGADSKAIDCNDASAAVHPGAQETIGDSVDSNCNGYKDIIYSVAGKAQNPGFSGDTGQGTLAKLNYPTMVAVDLQGNVFICDRYNARIRKVAANGVITTVAGDGSGSSSKDNVQATATSLSSPDGVAVDASGNFYIADDNRVRKVGTNGVITTVAGTGTAGFSGDGGNATSAKLNAPYGLAVSSQGVLLIADSSNHRIRQVSNGKISTVVGTGVAGSSGDGGAATSATINFPISVAFDLVGGFYLADYNSTVVRRVSSTGTISAVAGSSYGYSGDGGPATSARLKAPAAVTVDPWGTVFISDRDAYNVRMVTTGGTISTVVGKNESSTSDNVSANSAYLWSPYGVISDANGDIYLIDEDDQRARKISW